MAFHGIDFTEIKTGPISVNQIPSGVVGLIGTAPKGPVNSLILVSNPTDAAQFGEQVPGYTIPQALATHFAEGGQPILVGNVFAPGTDITAVTAETVVLAAGKAKLAFPPVGTTIVVTHTSGTPTYVRGTDYTIDDFGNIESINNTTIAQTASIKVTYSKPNFTAVDAARIIGTVSGSGARTGMKMFENAYNLYLLEPKIIIAPGFSELSAVVAEMVYWAERMLSIAIIDAPVGTTVAVAETSRGPAGTINFGVANERILLAFPHILSYDPASNTNIPKPYSQFLGGIAGRVDADSDSFHWSFSNKPIRTGVGVDVPVTSSFINSGTDSQKMNDKGIITVYQEGASGLRTNGNRNSAYPASTAITSFYACRRSVDIALRSIQLACTAYIDLPMSIALRNAILETANSYLRTLIAKGVFIDATCVYDEAKNPDSQIALGHWTLTLIWCPAPPFERGTFESFVDISLLSQLSENLS